jgi:hypothetical protein
MARLFMGNLRLRDAVFPDPAKRKDSYRAYEFVLMTLLNTRTTAQDITKLFAEHAQRVARGEVARMQGQALPIDENSDKELRKQTENFLNSAVRALKQGMQNVTGARGEHRLSVKLRLEMIPLRVHLDAATPRSIT